MPRLMWALLCQRVITDRDTNSVSYIDGVESLAAVQLPSPLPPLMIATVWMRKRRSESLRMRVRVLSPKSEEIVSYEVPTKLDFDDQKRQRVNINIGGLTIAAEGEYEVAIDQYVSKTWREEARVPLEIVLNKDNPTVQEAGSVS